VRPSALLSSPRRKIGSPVSSSPDTLIGNDSAASRQVRAIGTARRHDNRQLLALPSARLPRRLRDIEVAANDIATELGNAKAANMVMLAHISSG